MWLRHPLGWMRTYRARMGGLITCPTILFRSLLPWKYCLLHNELVSTERTRTLKKLRAFCNEVWFYWTITEVWKNCFIVITKKNLEALSVLMLCAPVFIFTSGSSAFLGRPRCGLSAWLSLIHFSEFMSIFLGENGQNTKILEVRHFRKMAVDSY